MSKSIKLKSLLSENALGELPSARLFKYNKETGKFDAPKSSTPTTSIKEAGEKFDYYPSQMLVLLQKCINTALKTGAIRVVGLDAADYGDTAEDLAEIMIKGQSLKGALTGMLMHL